MSDVWHRPSCCRAFGEEQRNAQPALLWRRNKSPRATRGACPVPVATSGYPVFVETASPTGSRVHPQSSGVPVRRTGTLSSNLAWRIPWTEEPGRLQSIGSQRVGHDWVTERTAHSWGKCLSGCLCKGIFFHSNLGSFIQPSLIPSRTTAGGGNFNRLQYPCLENSMDKGAWQATVHRVAELDVAEAT